MIEREWWWNKHDLFLHLSLHFFVKTKNEERIESSRKVSQQPVVLPQLPRWILKSAGFVRNGVNLHTHHKRALNVAKKVQPCFWLAGGVKAVGGHNTRSAPHSIPFPTFGVCLFFRLPEYSTTYMHTSTFFFIKQTTWCNTNTSYKQTHSWQLFIICLAYVGVCSRNANSQRQTRSRKKIFQSELPDLQNCC